MGWRKGGIHPPISCRDRKESLKRLRVFLKFLKAAEGAKDGGREGRTDGGGREGGRDVSRNPGKISGGHFLRRLILAKK